MASQPGAASLLITQDLKGKCSFESTDLCNKRWVFSVHSSPTAWVSLAHQAVSLACTAYEAFWLLAGAVGSTGTLQPVHCLLKAGMFPLMRPRWCSQALNYTVLEDMEVILSFFLIPWLTLLLWVLHTLVIFRPLHCGGSCLFLLNLE